MRVATYNIHRCIGRDGTVSVERIAAVLRRIDADVVALQEVAFDSANPQNVLARLAVAADAQAIAGPTLQARRGHYGNALLCRRATARVERLDISFRSREPRGVLAATLHFGRHRVKVVATHLGLFPRERRYQVQRLLPFLEATDVSTTVLLGDFNEWLSWSRPLRRVLGCFAATPALATFPSRRPLLPLDRIWVRPRKRLLALRVHREPPAPVASDHLPLVADLDLKT